MKKINLIILSILMLFVFQPSLLVASFIKNIGKTIGSRDFWEGMGKSFGRPAFNYTYSFEIWNDSNIPIYVDQEGIASFMGAYFPSARGIYGKKKLPSLFDTTKDSPSNISVSGAQYYFNLYISKNSHVKKLDSINTNSISKKSQKNLIYTENLTQLPLKQNDPTVHYYHVYTHRKFDHGKTVHVPKVEMLGTQNASARKDADKGNVVVNNQLSSLSFYNSSDKDVKVSLMYGIVPYTFTIEKHSHNVLNVPTQPDVSSKSEVSKVKIDTLKPADDVIIQSDLENKNLFNSQVVEKEIPVLENLTHDMSKQAVNGPDKTFSLRPNNLSFSAHDSLTNISQNFRKIVLPTTGFDQTPHTLEIFEDKGKSIEVGMQGFTTGNYDQAVMTKSRDLTPIPCKFWYQSALQAQASEGYIDLPGQVWIAYAGADSIIKSKVTVSEVVSWSLVRPLVLQGDQFVYFVYVATTDDDKAEKFVTSFMQKTIGKDLIDQYEKTVSDPIGLSHFSAHIVGTNAQNDDKSSGLTISAVEQAATLMGSLTVSNGLMQDSKTGVHGYLLGADVFTPKGIGSGNYYYLLQPSVMSSNQIVTLVAGCLDMDKISASNDQAYQALTLVVDTWLEGYIKDAAGTKSQVRSYLIKYGNYQVVDSANKLTKFGNNRLKTIMDGKVSLKFPPTKLSTVINQYVYDFGESAPENMPKNSRVIMPLKSA